LSAISAIEVQVNGLARKWFNSAEMTEATEFHAKCIYFGKFPCKGWKPDRRLEVLTALVDVIANNDNIRRLYAKINTTKLKAKDKAAEIAFAMFCERVQLLVGKKSTTLLIGDLDVEKSSATIEEFSKYRIEGTPWEYGTNIPSIVDCVHFAHSHHSRMVQLADVYLFAETHKLGTQGRDGRQVQRCFEATGPSSASIQVVADVACGWRCAPHAAGRAPGIGGASAFRSDEVPPSQKHAS
jgi:hypothetical protein